jgi:hypothetical protein
MNLRYPLGHPSRGLPILPLRFPIRPMRSSQRSRKWDRAMRQAASPRAGGVEGGEDPTLALLRRLARPNDRFITTYPA